MWRDLAYWFLWEFPSLPHTSLRLQYEEQAWNGTDVELKKWQKGVTGFPLVDAAMRQLWHVGWMPNYVRHVVAQMLIEYLDISWKHGLESPRFEVGKAFHYYCPKTPKMTWHWGPQPF